MGGYCPSGQVCDAGTCKADPTPTPAPTPPTLAQTPLGAWILGPNGEDCVHACEEIQMSCNSSISSTHFKDVGSEEALRDLAISNNWTCVVYHESDDSPFKWASGNRKDYC